MLRVVENPTKENEELRTTLDELLRRGALKMLHEAFEAEVEEHIQRHRDARDTQGRAQVVRNGRAPTRQLVTGSGPLAVRAPRINDRRSMPMVSVSDSLARFCPATCGGRRRWPRFSRFSICAGCRPAIPRRPCRSCSARRPAGCRRRRSRG